MLDNNDSGKEMLDGNEMSTKEMVELCKKSYRECKATHKSIGEYQQVFNLEHYSAPWVLSA